MSAVPWQCPSCGGWVAPGVETHYCRNGTAESPQELPQPTAAHRRITAESPQPTAESPQDRTAESAAPQTAAAVSSKALRSKALKPSNPKASAKKNHSYTPEFEEFWKVYPLRLDKWPAFRAWQDACGRAAVPQQIIEGALRYAAFCAANPDRSVKYAQGWLNGDRWLDEYPGILNGQRETAFDRAAREAMADAD